MGAAAPEVKRVLLLHSFERDAPPYDATVAAIREKLLQDSGENIAIFDASLEAGQATGADMDRSFLEFLRPRFSVAAPDVVITIASPAAKFFMKNRDDLFPRTPVVISALDERLIPPSLRAGDAVVASRHDLPALVENILQVLPDTRRIAVVLGDSPLERFWLTEFHSAFARFEDRLNFEWLNQRPLSDMRNRIAALPAHSVVLYAMLVVDASGIPHDRQAALRSLREVSTGPIFSVNESEFGHGVVGGPYQSQKRRGTMTAMAALRAVRGQASEVPDVQIVDYDTPIYDWRELKRWDIDPARLPAGSAVRFQPASLWHEHRVLIATTISIVVVQASLLVGLLWQRIGRRHAEKEAMSLSGRLITAHEDERRWLARELHDDITQRLAGLAIDAAKLSGTQQSRSQLDAYRAVLSG